MLELLRIKGFVAFILIAFINAFVDLGHKITIQNTLFKVYDGDTQILLTAIVNGLILLPFILLFTPAGFVSDKFPKHRVMRISAWAALAITLAITYCYYQGWFVAAFVFTFFLAVQSALYSPAKYGFIRELLGNERLSEGNGWIQACTMVAILSGIVAFSALFEWKVAVLQQMSPETIMLQIAPLGWLLVAGAGLEVFLSYRLPALSSTDETQRFDMQDYLTGRSLKRNLRALGEPKVILLSIIGLALFWSVSQVMLAVFPAYAEEQLGQSNTFVIQSVMALAGIGIMIGSVLAAHLSRHFINAGLIPLGAAGVALGLVSLPTLDSIWMSAGAFLLIGISGSLMTVPLNALIQFNAPESRLGRVLAGNNFIQNVAMLAFLVLTVVSATASISSGALLWLLGAVGVAGAIYAILLLPQALIRLMVSALVRRRYRLKVLGFEHLPANGEGVLLLGNHISWLDWAMLQLACPRHIYFVMERSIYERWYLRWFLDLYGVIPISSGASRSAMQKVRELLAQGEVVCLFPEGAISYSGQLGEFKRGFERLARPDDAHETLKARILPFYLRGLWGSRFSRSSERLQNSEGGGIKRDVIVAFGDTIPLDTKAEVVKQKVAELSIRAWNEYTDSLETLPSAFIRTAKAAPTEWALTDLNGPVLNHRRLLTACILFSRRMRQINEQNLGLLLPTAAGGAIANMAALMAGKTVVNLNYTAPEAALLSAVEQAGIKTIITSERFLDKLEQRGVKLDQLLSSVKVIKLEAVKAKIGKLEAVLTLIESVLLPRPVLQWMYGGHSNLDETAAILFSSGSEGAPKGVMLSHRNMMANLKQISSVLNVQDDDCILATLPLFHAFGLTVTCMLPLVEGIPVVCHPDPTDAVNIGKAAARYRATILCGTSTFLGLYMRNKRLHPLMFESLRVVVAGAEKLSPSIKSGFEARFKVPVLEGYGCTETTPVASVNLPDYLDARWWNVQIGERQGTVGMALPGSMFRIVDPDTLEQLPVGEDGLILLGGSQIMKGYLNNPEKTAEVVIDQDGLRWYKTGDKGRLDADGFLTIVDRYSRFAKVGGEMISLTAVETSLRKALEYEEQRLAAVAVPDARKGERIVLLVEEEPEQVSRQLRKADILPLHRPSEVIEVEQIPILGSGKADLAAVKRLALELIASDNA
ncbi:acyl-[ACP]--phospholipid O-acyltransferase [Marinobacterium sediminicola]|uniref:Acyl-[acyl-carrier-protein]-phospholipid O-acyltransferase / long-chain-fatty-acid--[acyl-carrier-protein] ligase n=1 Tax=Marinobacterium sediminicola TaxID=518898 RepID=A0ABY1RVY7_9GAMM|nr:acyl-[ACP]--phospholipid O-acyltransferase [Marinobacterium sediminicola]ULG70515.1 acyl-[ACP]--phospholipid O-acyltransferase [Marinobacterium sediminicola]SMR69121.1 acyl-[acyl-carrier-protein]-phospholipid O-acyltransferase / long-chain-fatty-acid--[acyl-carrier-protein] ligase [Marinobacterium sediminicola]